MESDFTGAGGGNWRGADLKPARVSVQLDTLNLLVAYLIFAIKNRLVLLHTFPGNLAFDWWSPDSETLRSTGWRP